MERDLVVKKGFEVPDLSSEQLTLESATSSEVAEVVSNTNELVAIVLESFQKEFGAFERGVWLKNANLSVELGVLTIEQFESLKAKFIIKLKGLFSKIRQSSLISEKNEEGMNVKLDIDSKIEEAFKKIDTLMNMIEAINQVIKASNIILDSTYQKIGAAKERVDDLNELSEVHDNERDGLTPEEEEELAKTKGEITIKTRKRAARKRGHDKLEEDFSGFIEKVDLNDIDLTLGSCQAIIDHLKQDPLFKTIGVDLEDLESGIDFQEMLNLAIKLIEENPQSIRLDKKAIARAQKRKHNFIVGGVVVGVVASSFLLWALTAPYFREYMRERNRKPQPSLHKPKSMKQGLDYSPVLNIKIPQTDDPEAIKKGIGKQMAKAMAQMLANPLQTSTLSKEILNGKMPIFQFNLPHRKGMLSITAKVNLLKRKVLETIKLPKPANARVGDWVKLAKTHIEREFAIDLDFKGPVVEGNHKTSFKIRNWVSVQGKLGKD